MEPTLGAPEAALQHQMQLQQIQHQHQQQEQHSYNDEGRSSNLPRSALHVSAQGAVGGMSRQSRTSASYASSQVDEAYQRLGHRLSARVHGNGPVTFPRQLSRMGLTPSSAFGRYDDVMSADVDEGKESPVVSPGSMKRTNKVAKMRYSDHGDHHRHSLRGQNSRVIRKLTVNAKEFYRSWQEDAVPSPGRKGKKRSPRQKHNSSRNSDGNGRATTDLSPHRFAFSQLALEGDAAQQQLAMLTSKAQNPAAQNQPSGQPKQTADSLLTESGAKKPNNQSLLSAVFENTLQGSGPGNTSKTRPDPKSVESSNSTESIAASWESLPKGKCLTKPSEPVCNNGLDNSEGNLVVHENDVISLAGKQMNDLCGNQSSPKHADFRIQSLLGHGTFAQVFKCLHLQTGNIVALKIVKNKPAYTRQAAIEVDVFRALRKPSEPVPSQPQGVLSSPSNSTAENSVSSQSGYKVEMMCYFMYEGHLCLVFELLGLNLYEILKKRQFRGPPLSVVRTLMQQAIYGVRELGKKNVVHCDIKPENILVASENDADSVVSAGENRRSSSKGTSSNKKRTKPKAKKSAPQSNFETPYASRKQAAQPTPSPTNGDAVAHVPGTSLVEQKIKLIDFGSACFEGQTAHTYIQSRFYRSPEVLVGLPYDSSIDLWSLGCVAAELFLGLPILPGVHEHDQLGRIEEMIASIPDWMLEQGSKTAKYFVKYVSRDRANPRTATPTPPPAKNSPPPGGLHAQPRPLPQWRLRTRQEYVSTLSQSEIRKRGGLAKLQKQPTSRYFKGKKLGDIIRQKGRSAGAETKADLELFEHFLYGLLEPDPWKRWTAQQAAQHPFLVGGLVQRRSDKVPQKDENQANSLCDMYWEAPFDPGVCRRKLQTVQKMRDQQKAARRGHNSRSQTSPVRPASASSQDSVDRAMSDTPVARASPKRNAGPNRTKARQGSLSFQPSALQAQHPVGLPISSSFTDSASAVPIVHMAGEDSSLGARRYPPGPMSFADTEYSGSIPGSFNEVDFAYVLQRPGVVPDGGPALDFGVGANLSQQQLAALGVMGVQHHPHGNQSGTSRRVFASSSFGDNIMTSGHHQHGMIPRAGQVGHPIAGGFTQPSNASLFHGQDAQGYHQSLGGQMQQPGNQVLPGNHISQNLQQLHAQAFLQQQHAALQQQQLMVQQQQAALFLQQHELQAYGTNPGFDGAGQAIIRQVTDQLVQGNNFFYAPSTDGAPLLMSNPGAPQPVAMQGIPPQPAMGAMHSNMMPPTPNLQQPFHAPGFDGGRMSM